LNHYINIIFQQDNTPLNIVEIGPGVGNLALVLMKRFQKRPIKYILVDLPEALPFSISHLMYWMPEMSFVLPHELSSVFKAGKENIDSQIIFMTHQQIQEIPDHSIDLGVNTNSFAEMPSGEIEKYFHFLRKTLKKENIFFTVNRVEKAIDLKTQQSADPKVASEKMYIENDNSFEIKRFQNYPWSSEDHTYAYYIEPFNMCKTAKNFWLKIVKMQTES
jgi:hypothetical protein